MSRRRKCARISEASGSVIKETQEVFIFSFPSSILSDVSLPVLQETDEVRWPLTCTAAAHADDHDDHDDDERREDDMEDVWGG